MGSNPDGSGEPVSSNSVYVYVVSVDFEVNPGQGLELYSRSPRTRLPVENERLDQAEDALAKECVDTK